MSSGWPSPASSSVDAAAHTVLLDSGQELGYQKLLIATGGRNRRLEIPGAELPGIHYLRTVAECDAIKREAVAGRRAVVVGMGFIGCEVAASLTQLGVHVTAIFPGQVPLERVLGEEVGAVIGAIHRANGVELLAGEQVAAFEGTERLEAAVTASGDRVRVRLRRRRRRDRARCPGLRGAVGRAGQRRSGRRAVPGQRRRRLRRRRCREPPPPAVRPGPGRALQQRRETGARGGEIDARLGCSLRLHPHASGPISTSTSSSTSATPRSGTSSWSAGAWRKESWSGSTCWRAWCRPPSGSTAAATPSWTATRRWRHAPRLVAERAAACSPACSPTSSVDLWSLGPSDTLP